MPTTHHSTDPWLDDRRTAEPAEVTGADAASSARILHRAAGVLLAVVSVIAACAIVSGIALYAKANTTGDRIVALVIVGSAVVSWLTVALQCLVGQAVARYIESRSR